MSSSLRVSLVARFPESVLNGSQQDSPKDSWFDIRRSLGILASGCPCSGVLGRLPRNHVLQRNHPYGRDSTVLWLKTHALKLWLPPLHKYNTSQSLRVHNVGSNLAVEKLVRETKVPLKIWQFTAAAPGSSKKGSCPQKTSNQNNSQQQSLYVAEIT